jgi:hypothetical protein
LHQPPELHSQRIAAAKTGWHFKLLKILEHNLP